MGVPQQCNLVNKTSLGFTKQNQCAASIFQKLLSQLLKLRLLSQKFGFIYPVCNMPIYTQSRGILLHICTDMDVCPKTAHLIHKLTVIYTLNITIFIFLIHMHCYSSK